MANLADLSAKDIVELRIACIDTLAGTLSRHDLQHRLFELAEDAWSFSIKPLGDMVQGQLAKSPKAREPKL